MFDRRQFLIGAAGSLLTTAFVRKAKIFSLRNDEPLLTPPGRQAEETLFINSGFREHAKWRWSLGPIDVEAPPPPTWREHLRELRRSPRDGGRRTSAPAPSAAWNPRNSTPG